MGTHRQLRGPLRSLKSRKQKRPAAAGPRKMGWEVREGGCQEDAGLDHGFPISLVFR